MNRRITVHRRQDTLGQRRSVGPSLPWGVLLDPPVLLLHPRTWQAVTTSHGISGLPASPALTA